MCGFLTRFSTKPQLLSFYSPVTLSVVLPDSREDEGGTWDNNGTHQFRHTLILRENGMGILQFVCWIKAKFEGITPLSTTFNLF